MRIANLLLMSGVLMAACSVSKTEESTGSDSTDVSELVAENFPYTVWEIPLSSYWENKKDFVLLMPDSGVTVSIRSEPMDDRRITWEEADTLQGKILGREEVTEACADYSFYRVEAMATEPQYGWVPGDEVYIVDKTNLGDFNVEGRRLKLGIMKPKAALEGDGTCYIMYTFFFYDDTRLYLIENNRSVDNPDLRWPKQKHFSLVTQNNITTDFTGGMRNDGFVISWGQPYLDCQVVIAWDDGHLKLKSYDEQTIDMGHHDMEVEEGDGAEDEVITALCEFTGAESGDCFYRYFSCEGDFSNATTDESISSEDYELWANLSIDTDNGTAGNPDYMGATFEITFSKIEREICGDPGGPAEVAMVPNIMKFKLVKKK